MHHPKCIVLLHRFLTTSHGVSYEETHVGITYYWKYTQLLTVVNLGGELSTVTCCFIKPT